MCVAKACWSVRNPPPSSTWWPSNNRGAIGLSSASASASTLSLDGVGVSAATVLISLISCWSPRRQSWSECASAIAAVASFTSGPPEATHAASAARAKEATSGDGGSMRSEGRARAWWRSSRDEVTEINYMRVPLFIVRHYSIHERHGLVHVGYVGRSGSHCDGVLQVEAEHA